MIMLEILTLIDIAAKSILKDENTLHIYEAISYVINNRNNKNRLKFFSYIETMSENEIDELIWEFNIKNITSDTDKKMKIEILKQTLANKFNKGTVASLKNVLKGFWKDVEVKEWFEYGGNPGYFKVLTNEKLENEISLKHMLNIVDDYKNVRSWFDGFKFLRETKVENNIFNLFKSNVTNFITMREFELPWFNNNINSEILSNTTMLNNLMVRE